MKKSIVLMVTLAGLVAVNAQAMKTTSASGSSQADSLWEQTKQRMKTAKSEAAKAWRDMSKKVKESLSTTARKAYQDLEVAAGAIVINNASSYDLVIKAALQSEKLQASDSAGASKNYPNTGYVLLPVGNKFTIIAYDKKAGAEKATSSPHIRKKGYDVYELNYSDITGKFTVTPLSVKQAKAKTKYSYLNLI